MQPDLVLYALYLGNDISRNDNWIETNDGHLVALEHMPPVRTARSLKLLELWDTVAYGRRLYRDDRRAEWEPFPDYLEMCERHPSPRTSVRWDSVERLLTRIRDDATAAGAKLLVAPFSYRTANDPAARAGFLLRHPDFSVDHDFALPRQRILEMLDRLTIDAVDIDAAIGRHYARGGDPLYYTRDGHWNALGHRVAATAHLPVVREALGFRPRRPHQDA